MQTRSQTRAVNERREKVLDLIRGLPVPSTRPSGAKKYYYIVLITPTAMWNIMREGKDELGCSTWTACEDGAHYCVESEKKVLLELSDENILGYYRADDEQGEEVSFVAGKSYQDLTYAFHA